MKEYLKTKNGILYHADCLDVMPYLSKKNIKFDLILTDPPYGITACKWDSVIPLDKLWLNINRIINDNTPIALFGSEPFSSKLRISNLKNFRYDWIWEKERPTGFGNAKRQPLKINELISIFYKHQCAYYPKMILLKKSYRHILPIVGTKTYSSGFKSLDNEKREYKTFTHSYPRNIIKFNRVYNKNYIHPTQKPVPLYEYLIKTYTKENDLVLDFCSGSGTLGIACENLNRKYIMVEKELKYCEIIKKRLIDNNIEILN